MKDFEEKACLCALAKIFGFEPKTALALIAHCGCAGSIFSLDEKDIDGLLGPYSRYRTQIRRSAVYEAAESLERLGRNGIRFVGWGEEGYPELLAECPDAPIGLYVRSCTPPSEFRAIGKGYFNHSVFNFFNCYYLHLRSSTITRRITAQLCLYLLYRFFYLQILRFVRNILERDRDISALLALKTLQRVAAPTGKSLTTTHRVNGCINGISH